MGLTQEQFPEVTKVAQAIAVLHPHLGQSKKFQYALGIVKASLKYAIDPFVIVAITHQETTFRENLPEGKAGEIGICQIQKYWLTNARFRSEFKKATVRDLKNPSRSFMFAAWILNNLKEREDSLPYWSFYNSMTYKHRLKYFHRVKRNIAAIQRSGILFAEKAASQQVRRTASAAQLPLHNVAKVAMLSKNDRLLQPIRVIENSKYRTP